MVSDFAAQIRKNCISSSADYFHLGALERLSGILHGDYRIRIDIGGAGIATGVIGNLLGRWLYDAARQSQSVKVDDFVSVSGQEFKLITHVDGRQSETKLNPMDLHDVQSRIEECL